MHASLQRRPRRMPRQTTRRGQTARLGFTLLELLLVMAILVVLASLSTFAILNLRDSTSQQAAQVQIETLKDACTMYKLSVGSFPRNLNDLQALPSGMTPQQWGGPYLDESIPMDPWGRPYNYTPDNVAQTVRVTSNGPDGQRNTSDDVPQTGG